MLPEYKYVPSKHPARLIGTLAQTELGRSGPRDLFPVELIKGLDRDLFWALLVRTVGEWSVDLLIMRGILPENTVFHVIDPLIYPGNVLTGYPLLPTVFDVFHRAPDGIDFDRAYNYFVQGIISCAVQVKLNIIDPNLSYYKQYEILALPDFGSEGNEDEIDPVRGTVPYNSDDPFNPDTHPELGSRISELVHPNTVMYFVLCRYLFYRNYKETPAFLKFLQSRQLMSQIGRPSDQKIFLLLVEQICPSCRYLDEDIINSLPAHAIDPNGVLQALPYDIKYIIATQMLKPLKINDHTAKRMGLVLPSQEKEPLKK